VDKIVRGVPIEGRKVEIDILEPARGGRYKIAIHEGRNRIIRRLFGEAKYNVIELKRIRIGSISLGKLAIGKWRKLTPIEVERLKADVKA
jgi:pseudouridine synthase